MFIICIFWFWNIFSLALPLLFFIYVPDFCPLLIDVVCIVNVSVWEAKVVVALAGPRYFQLGPAGPPHTPLRVTLHIHMLDTSKQPPSRTKPSLVTTAYSCLSPKASLCKAPHTLIVLTDGSPAPIILWISVPFVSSPFFQSLFLFGCAYFSSSACLNALHLCFGLLPCLCSL